MAPIQYSLSNNASLPMMGHRFEVIVDSYGTLGHWSKLSGLAVTFDLAEHRIGATDEYFKYAAIPKFEKLKLQRAADQTNTMLVKGWLDKVNATGGELSTGSVSVMSSSGAETMIWNLQAVFPYKWGISDFDASAGKVVVETLEIVYSGFLEARKVGK
jgi:phage tail-like protein